MLGARGLDYRSTIYADLISGYFCGVGTISLNIIVQLATKEICLAIDYKANYTIKYSKYHSY